MAASILSTSDTGSGIVVVITTNGTTPAAQFSYPETPPDGRSQAQWLTDCGNAALGIDTDPALGDGAPDASVEDNTFAVTG